MKKLTGIIVASLVVLLVAGTESMSRENEHGDSPSAHFGGSKTMVDSPMHHRGAGKVMSRDDMMTHALRNPEIAEKIGLSEEQRDKISRRIEKMEDKNLDLKYKIEKAALKQARLMTTKDLDEEALMAVVDELGKYRTQQAKQRIGMLIFMRKTLTDEQATKMREIMRDRMQERRKEYSRDWRRNAKHGAEKRDEPEAKRRKHIEDQEK